MFFSSSLFYNDVGGAGGGLSPPSQQDDVFRFTDWFIVSLRALNTQLANHRIAPGSVHEGLKLALARSPEDMRIARGWGYFTATPDDPNGTRDPPTTHAVPVPHSHRSRVSPFREGSASCGVWLTRKNSSNQRHNC